MSKHWTSDSLPDLTGKTIIITGANSGLGFEATKLFARNGAKVILCSRDIARGEMAARDVLEKYPDAKIEVMALDLADLESIHNFAESYSSKHDRLDILLNNAGIMWCPYGLTKQGFEQQLGINHLGHFALTGLLLDKLKATPASRVVTVSSMGHRNAKFDAENPLLTKSDYARALAYFNSKLANLLFAYELQHRFENAGLDVLSVAAHPGGSNTNLGRYIEEKFWFKLLRPLMLILAQPAAMGTLPEVRAAVDPKVKGGSYWGPRGFAEMRGYPVEVDSTPASKDKASAAMLWKRSEELTGIEYDFSLAD